MKPLKHLNGLPAIVCLIGCVGVSASAWAQPQNQQPQNQQPQNQQPQNQQPQNQQPQNQQPLNQQPQNQQPQNQQPPVIPGANGSEFSSNFGVGVMATFDILGSKHGKRVNSARLVGGKVWVEDASRAQVGLVLEAHRFIKKKGKYSIGPFLGFVVSDTAIETAALGVMWGFNQSESGQKQPMNIGLGIAVSPRAKLLGEGIKEGEPLPAGETEVRYKTKALYGLAIMASFGF